MVGRYYDHLLPRLVSRLLENGGNILMIQVENEYSSYGEWTYLREIRRLMKNVQWLVHLYIWWSMAERKATPESAGALIEDDLSL